MPFCHKCGHKLADEDDFCVECGAKPKHKEKHNVEKVEEHHYHEKQRSSWLPKLILFILILGILGIVLFAVVESGVLDDFGGMGAPPPDPCEIEFNDCNHGCGEGWLAGVCKEKCSYEYRQCK